MAENTLLEKVLSLQDKYRKLEESLADPAVIADSCSPSSRPASSTSACWTSSRRRRTSS